MPTIIVGLIFVVIIFLAARSSFKRMKEGKCASCSCGCENKKPKTKTPDEDKIIL